MLSAVLLATLTIRADRVIDGRGNVYPNAAVVIDANKIVGIDKDPKHADVDLGHRTIMPGGIDTHVHIGWHFDAADGRSHDDETDRNETPQETVLYATENAVRTLTAGITTVQSLGATVDKPVRDANNCRILPG